MYLGSELTFTSYKYKLSAIITHAALMIYSRVHFIIYDVDDLFLIFRLRFGCRRFLKRPSVTTVAKVRPTTRELTDVVILSRTTVQLPLLINYVEHICRACILQFDPTSSSVNVLCTHLYVLLRGNLCE